ncbi:MAG: metallophosphoesterase [Gammaproteobacteria bacterium]
MSEVRDQWDDIERIVALGDLHGDYERYVEALFSAGLVDSEHNWIGGETHFVQIGDIPDRGPDSTRIIRHLQSLERQALRAGGRVHALIGNHEAMNMSGELRYVHPGEFEALRSPQAEQLRDTYYSVISKKIRAKPAPSLHNYVSRRECVGKVEIPLGYVEYREHWAPGGEFGEWVAGHNTVVRLNNLLFVHGGLSLKYADWTIREINERVKAELRNIDSFADPITQDYLGPLWYRGLSQDEEAAAPAFVAALLESHDVDHIVVGHTPCCETIVPRYDGKVLVIDSGISSFYDGALTLLIVERGELFNLQSGKRFAIPADDCELLDYYRAIFALEPDSVSLRESISRLEMKEMEWG